ncbi:hypothetical protein J4402_04520 [Candidatus Pacearchaeota archaeon]|nr:hypothetical protein [Candidatus Pacearchaeota archaeon]
MDSKNRNVPLKAKVIAHWFGFYPGIILAIIGFIMLYFPNPRTFSSVLFGSALIILGIFVYILGINLRKGYNWARIGIVGVTIAGILFSIYRIITINRYSTYHKEEIILSCIVYIIIAILVSVYLLFNKDVKSAFVKI